MPGPSRGSRRAGPRPARRRPQLPGSSGNGAPRSAGDAPRHRSSGGPSRSRVSPSRHEPATDPRLARLPRPCATIPILDQPTMPTAPPKQARGAALWINLAIIYVVWGSTYFGIAIAIQTMPPFLMSAIRFAVAGALLVSLDLLRNPSARRLPTRRELR